MFFGFFDGFRFWVEVGFGCGWFYFIFSLRVSRGRLVSFFLYCLFFGLFLGLLYNRFVFTVRGGRVFGRCF